MGPVATVLITGANRGIGKGLATAYLATPNTTVVATVRDPSHPTSQALCFLPKAHGSTIIILKLDVSSAGSIQAAISDLSSTHNIHALDVVIANAGIAEITGPLASTSISEIQKYIDVNALGQLELFKVVAKHLRASKSGKFALISSAGGSIANMNTALPLAAYGASKALANFLIKWLALENTDLMVWAMHPGMVATEMGEMGFRELKKMGIDVSSYAISVEQSTQGIKDVIQAATFENASGKFIAYDGSELAW